VTRAEVLAVLEVSFPRVTIEVDVEGDEERAFLHSGDLYVSFPLDAMLAAQCAHTLRDEFVRPAKSFLEWKAKQ
jgi:hypothetical protein